MCRPNWSIEIESLLIVANPDVKTVGGYVDRKRISPARQLRDSIQRIRQTKLLRRNTRSVGSGSQSLGNFFGEKLAAGGMSPGRRYFGEIWTKRRSARPRNTEISKNGQEGSCGLSPPHN